MEFNSGTAQHRTVRLIFLPLTSGMLTAQTIASIFVYLSNKRIYYAADAAEKAGFFPFPAGQAMASLNHLGPAVWGGLFFTLSIGIGLTLASWAAIRIWDLHFKRHPKVLIGYGIIWIGLLAFINIKGITLFPSLFCLLVPLATGWVTIKNLGSTVHPKTNLWFIPTVTLILLTALWTTQLNTTYLFVNIRDHVLLTNPVGQFVNDFYYRYTLYAAETFKPINQKTVRTCKLEGFTNIGVVKQLKSRLAQRDVLVLPTPNKTDIVLTSNNGSLRLQATSGKSIEITIKEFLAAPDTWLLKLSQITDHYAQFRLMILVGLLIGFPILLYVIAYGLLSAALSRLVDDKRSVWLGSTICLLIGILLFLPMLNARPLTMTEEKMGKALASDQWPHRVAALRYSDAQNVEIANYPVYQNLFTSRLVVERYWLARALAKSRAPSNYPRLLAMINDHHPNVTCQAFYALGERGRRVAIQHIQQKILGLDHWYAQWYGYRALRKLRWHQRPSN